MKVVCWPTWITVLCCLFFERLVLAVCGLPVSNQLGPRPIRACGGGGGGWGSHFKDCEISKSAQVYQWISVSESVEFSSVHFAMWQSQGPKVKQKKFSFQFIYYLTKHIYIKLMWHERYPKDTQIQAHMRASWNFISIWKKFDFIYLSQHHQKTSWISAFLLEFLYFFFGWAGHSWDTFQSFVFNLRAAFSALVSKQQCRLKAKKKIKSPSRWRWQENAFNWKERTHSHGSWYEYEIMPHLTFSFADEILHEFIRTAPRNKRMCEFHIKERA